MATIIKIVGVEKLTSQKGVPFERTHAVLSDGTECVGFTSKFAVGDKVEVFYHREMVKMKKGIDRTVKP